MFLCSFSCMDIMVLVIKSNYRVNFNSPFNSMSKTVLPQKVMIDI